MPISQKTQLEIRCDEKYSWTFQLINIILDRDTTKEEQPQVSNPDWNPRKHSKIFSKKPPNFRVRSSISRDHKGDSSGGRLIGAWFPIDEIQFYMPLVI